MTKEMSAPTRRSFVKMAGLALTAGTLSCLARQSAGASEPGKSTASLEGEGYGVRFSGEVSGLGTSTLQIAFEVELTAEGQMAPSVVVTLRPTDTDGFFLDDVRLDLGFGEQPLAFGEVRPGTASFELEEPVASVELVGVEAQLRSAVWSGSGVSVYVLTEEPGELANTLTLLVAARTSGTRVSELVFHTSVYDASGREMGTPDLVVVSAENEPLELAPTAVVRAELPWREGATGWEIIGAEAQVERPNIVNFSTVEFGSYPQGPNGEVEPIEWYVLAEEGGRQLLLSKYVLDALPYNEEWEDVTWETCSLRTWLNGEFGRTAFSSDERSRIAEVDLENPDNPDFETPGGNPTKDRVFLLSIDEAMRYFGVGRTSTQLFKELGDDLYDADGNADYERIYAEEPGYEALVATATDYAIERGMWVWESEAFADYDGGSCWWLRSPGDDAFDAAYVSPDGHVISFGIIVDRTFVGVRPALWLDL